MQTTKIVAFLCAFMYFSSPYRLFGHAMPEIIGVITILIQLTKYKKFIVLKGYGAFMIYMLIFPATISLVTNLPGNYVTSFIPINLLFYSFAFCFLLPTVNKYYVLKYYKILVYISITFFIIQEFTYYTIGNRPTFYLPLEMYYEGSDVTSFSESRATMSRSSSFFLEPAHFAQYILPYCCIVSYNCIKDKIITKEFIIIITSLLFLQSGSGYLGLISIFASIIIMKGVVSPKVKLSIIIITTLIIGAVAIIFYNNIYLMELLTRMNEVTTLEVNAHGSQSGFLRIWRGYIIYDSLAPIYKIFGVGTGSIEYISKIVYIPGSRYEGSYMNGIQTLLISGGILGTLLFFRFIKKSWNQLNAEGVIIIICMLSMFFIEHMLFTPKMFLFILIAFAVSKNYVHIK